MPLNTTAMTTRKLTEKLIALFLVIQIAISAFPLAVTAQEDGSGSSTPDTEEPIQQEEPTDRLEETPSELPTDDPQDDTDHSEQPDSEEIQITETEQQEEPLPETDPGTESVPEAPEWFEDTAELGAVKVTVRALQRIVPAGAHLEAALLEDTDRQEAEQTVDEVREEERTVAVSYSFDIRILDAEEKEWQPEEQETVEVIFSVPEISEENLEPAVYHLKEEDGEQLTAEKIDTVSDTEAGTLSAETDGFSVYTVEFTYQNLQYVLNGNETIPLTVILEAVGLSGEAETVSVSNAALFSAEETEAGWMITAHQPFSSPEKMIVRIAGIYYEIAVTDEQILTADSGTYVITIDLLNNPGSFYDGFQIDISDQYWNPLYNYTFGNEEGVRRYTQRFTVTGAPAKLTFEVRYKDAYYTEFQQMQYETAFETCYQKDAVNQNSSDRFVFCNYSIVRMDQLSYIDENGNEKTAPAHTSIASGTSNWTNDWYAADHQMIDIEVPQCITVSGDVKLILCDDCKLIASKGIELQKDASLTIYGQHGGTGQLFAYGSKNNAGIRVQSNSSFIMNGGRIYAEGSKNGAGIGGNNGESSGSVTMNNGDITAKGGIFGAGIGGGNKGSSGTFTMKNGIVRAEGGNLGAGIGGGPYGSSGAIIINGGSVSATGGYHGAGIGGGAYGTNGAITINNGTVTAVAIEGKAPFAPMLNGGAGIGAGANQPQTGVITIKGGRVEAMANGFGAGIGGGAYNTDGFDASIININGGYIKSVSLNGAGIGGGGGGGGISTGISPTGTGGNGGTITISDGEVYAWSLLSGAGIGGGNYGNGGTITISGGKVYASGGFNKYQFFSDGLSQWELDGVSADPMDKYMDNLVHEIIANVVLKWLFNRTLAGAGIGGGGKGDGGTVTITGGTVEAVARAGFEELTDNEKPAAIGKGIGKDLAKGTINFTDPAGDQFVVYAGDSMKSNSKTVKNLSTACQNNLYALIKLEPESNIHKVTVRRKENSQPSTVQINLLNRAPTPVDQRKTIILTSDQWTGDFQTIPECKIELSETESETAVPERWELIGKDGTTIVLPSHPSNPRGAYLYLTSLEESGLSESDFNNAKAIIRSGEGVIQVTDQPGIQFGTKINWEIGTSSVKPSEVKVILQKNMKQSDGSMQWQTLETLNLNETLWKGTFAAVKDEGSNNSTVYRIRELNDNGTPVYAATDPESPTSKPVFKTLANHQAVAYDASYSTLTDKSITITNKTVDTSTYTIAGRIVWNDNNNAAGDRPDDTTISVRLGASIIASKTVSASDGWVFSFKNLKNPTGGETYTVVQDNIPIYTTSVTTTGKTVVVTNTYPETVSIAGTITWNDTGDESRRPSALTVNVMQEKSIVATKTFSSKDQVEGNPNQWNYSFSSLPKYTNTTPRTEIPYTIAVIEPEGYTSSIGENHAISIEYQERTSGDTVTVSGKIQWEDTGVEYLRPDSVRVYLLRDSDSIVAWKDVTEDSLGKWDFSFPNLPGDTTIIYYVLQEELEDYVDTYLPNYVIKNTLISEEVVSLSGTIEWSGDQPRPDYITIHAIDENTGDIYDSISVSTETTSWSISDLPKYDDASGSEINYSVIVEDIIGFNTTVSENPDRKYVISNTIETEETYDGDYAVNIWYQENGDYKENPSLRMIRHAPYETKVSLSRIDYNRRPGYVIDTEKQNITSGTLTKDNPLELCMYLKQQFVISIDPNGGSWSDGGGILTKTVDYGTVIQLPEAPKREGYTFLYWKGSAYQPGQSYTVTNNHTFTAEWKKNDSGTKDEPTSGSAIEQRVKVVNTADQTNIPLWSALLGSSFLIMLGACWVLIKDKALK